MALGASPARATLLDVRATLRTRVREPGFSAVFLLTARLRIRRDGARKRRGGLMLPPHPFDRPSVIRGEEPDLSFWRDSAGHEIDLLLEYGGELVPIEVKSGQTVVRDFFSGIEYWRRLTGELEKPAALVYGGHESYRRSAVCVYSWIGL